LKILILGATSAIAQETAKCFAADGADLVLAGRNGERLTQIGDDLKVRGAGQVASIVADLADLSGHQALIQEAAEKVGGLDAALIAHGTLGDQPKSEADVDEMLRQMNTNALSWMSLLTLLGNYFEQKRGGCICDISSVAGERGRGSNYVYGSAKAAVTAFTSGLRARLSKAGVSVVTIKPGFVDTPMAVNVKKGPLMAKPDKVGRRIYEAMLKGEDVVYVPWFWAPIMQVIRAVPERVFKKTKL
jgi:short-subunit dehydrogenase